MAKEKKLVNGQNFTDKAGNPADTVDTDVTGQDGLVKTTEVPAAYGVLPSGQELTPHEVEAQEAQEKVAKEFLENEGASQQGGNSVSGRRPV